MEFEQGYAVIARRYHGDVLCSFHGSDKIAISAAQKSIDNDPLRVEAAEVAYGENGNVRMWRCKLAEEVNMPNDKHSAILYVVKDEHTLGFVFDAQPGLMSVLSNKSKSPLNLYNSPVLTSPGNIRPATEDDFHHFRVVVPPDFRTK